MDGAALDTDTSGALVKVDVDELTRGLYYCMHCSLCKAVLPSEVGSDRFSEVCPPGARYRFDAFFGSGRAGFYRAFFTGEFGFDESPRLPEVVYSCQNCGSCSISCRYTSAIGQVDLERATEIMRARCVEEGLSPVEHSLMVQSMRQEDNVLGEPKAARGDWAEGLGLKDINSEKAEILFHAGCRYSYDADLRSAVRDAAGVLVAAGLDVGIAGKDEACCGGRAYEVGYQGELVKYADDMASRIRASGATTVVTPCADCYYTFRRLFPLVGRPLEVEVLHINEMIARLIAKGVITFKEMVPLRVTYHDPCHIGRKMYPEFMYEVPRLILGEIPGVELVEMERIRDCTWCCGAGGGVLEAYPEFNDWTAGERVAEALSTGADALVSSCPWCERNFIDAVAGAGAGMHVYDVVELVGAAMGGVQDGNRK
ncbi:MAG: (Fe-S)-binding protein [Actinobacteria bacterium]|nr:(Fe-S)-binding protein [Actinomycetota bacterium]MBU1944923.1 (Fe-S)-binding protein [Actinomycetota bacterium]MBU2688151.1 (Fe-S)-binding protein [Actinomycetota bacterium]